MQFLFTFWHEKWMSSDEVLIVMHFPIIFYTLCMVLSSCCIFILLKTVVVGSFLANLNENNFLCYSEYENFIFIYLTYNCNLNFNLFNNITNFCTKINDNSKMQSFCLFQYFKCVKLYYICRFYFHNWYYNWLKYK